jgi:hypothetical protein
MPEVVRQPAAVESTPTVSFDFSPHGGAFSYSSSLATYSPAGAFYAASNTSLTFTSSVSFGRSTEYATGYEWDFGDGNRGFGASVSHTYKNPGTTQVSLTVIDNKGRRWYTRKQLYLTGLSSYRNLVLSLGPSLYWPLDATYGATDQSGNGRNGTGAGGITIGGGGSPFAGETTSTDFDGIDDRITSTYNPFSAGTIRSFAGWANRDTSGANHVLFGGMNASGEPQLQLDGSQNVHWYADSGGSNANWAAAWPGNTQWVHWGLVFDDAGDQASLYINGGLISTQTFTGVYSSPGTISFGSVVTGFSWFDGKQAHVGVWERGLAPSEIYSLYTG